MAISITHTTQITGTDDPAKQVSKNVWNAGHTVTGAAASGANSDITSITGLTTALTVAQGGTGATTLTGIVLGNGTLAFTALASTGTGDVVRATSPTLVTPALGTPSSGTLTSCTGLPEAGLTLADNTTANVSATAHGFAPKFPNNTTTFLRGDGTYAAPGAGALSGITAATAANTIANGTNSGQVWNWALAADSVTAFTFGETTAATGGTNLNQVLLAVSTLAASTAVPFQVKARGANALVVTSTGTVGINTTSNAMSGKLDVLSADNANTCVFKAASGALWIEGWRDSTLGTLTQALDAGGTGYQTWSFSASVYHFTQGNVGIGGTHTTAGLLDVSGATADAMFRRASADATAFALNFRKARGTVASPTVITTGDDLATLSGYGYVGATNTYQEAARITFDSTGTISDSATGIGGIIRFLTAAVGAEPAEVLTLMTATTTGGGWAIMDEADANPTTTELDANDSVAIYNTNNKIVIAYNNAGTITYLSCALDGSTVTWVNSTVAP